MAFNRSLPIPSALLLACLASPLAGGKAQASPDGRPNIVLILSDDIRLDDLGAYGGNYLTPAMDRLAAQSVRFQHATVPTAACTPSRFAVLTGSYPGRARNEEFQPLEGEPANITWNTFVTEGQETIATLLNEAGYQTGMAGKWHVSTYLHPPEVPKIAKDADLDDPETTRLLQQHQQAIVDEVKRVAGFDFAASILEGNAPNLPIDSLKAHHLEWITKGALEFLDTTTREEPFFLYLAPTSVHSPSHDWTLDKDWRYTPSGKLTEEEIAVHPSRETVRTRLEEAGLPVEHRTVGLLMMSDMLDTVTAKLNEMGVAEETLVVFVGDHGVEPGKLVCYEEGVRVPMFASWPGRLLPGTTTEALVSTVDLAATFSYIAGGPAPSSPDGFAFLHPGEHGVSTDRRYAFFEGGYTRGVSDGVYKYITLRFPSDAIAEMQDGTRDMAPNHAMMPGQEQPYISMQCYPHYYDADQLYYLPADPYEQHNIIGEPTHAGAAARLRAALVQHVASFDHSYPMEQDFLLRAEYRALAEKSQARKLEGQDWWWSLIDRFRSLAASGGEAP